MRRGRERIVFGHMHEDPTTEERLVGVTPGPRALVVASGGDLALALVGCGLRVDAIDSNPAQLRLLRLKIAAARTGGPDQAATWMTSAAAAALGAVGVEESAWWTPRASQLGHGLCFCGSVDRRLRTIGRVVRWAYDWPTRSAGPLRRTVVSACRSLVRLAATSLHGRAAGARLDRAALLLLERRFLRALHHADAGTNPLLQVLLGHGFGSSVPRVWSAVGIREWASRIEGLSLGAASLESTLAERPEGSLGLISASNVADLLDEAGRAELLDRAARALGPGGHLVLRSMLCEHPGWRHVAFEEVDLDSDRSPLCPVVWVGRRRA